MRRLASLAVLIVLAGVPAPVHAADKDQIEKRYSVIYAACMEKAASTADYVDCIGAELTFQDKYLNRRYQDLMAELTPAQKDKLRKAQRDWMAFRDSWCAAQQDSDWGSLSTIVANQCVLDQTIGRTIDLENYPPGT
ncbi:MAG: lysozyme inhibitor LprI family protein [Caulobacteraceae bacterium]|nr:lysozyme inhibitor LprI family protein [Caulobacteraceae bacterium]